jgi:hypothetical protein
VDDAPGLPAAGRVALVGMPVMGETFRCDRAAVPVLAQLPPARAGTLLTGRVGMLTVVRLGVRN